MRLKRLTSEDFTRLASCTRLKEQTRQLAREVLVDGYSMSSVATRAGMTPQRVALAVGVIERAYFADKEGSLGWVSLDMELPESIALQLDELAQVLKASGDRSVLEQVTRIITAAVVEAHRLLE